MYTYMISDKSRITGKMNSKSFSDYDDAISYYLDVIDRYRVNVNGDNETEPEIIHRLQLKLVRTIPYDQDRN